MATEDNVNNDKLKDEIKKLTEKLEAQTRLNKARYAGAAASAAASQLLADKAKADVAKEAEIASLKQRIKACRANGHSSAVIESIGLKNKLYEKYKVEII